MSVGLGRIARREKTLRVPRTSLNIGPLRAQARADRFKHAGSTYTRSSSAGCGSSVSSTDHDATAGLALGLALDHRVDVTVVP